MLYKIAEAAFILIVSGMIMIKFGFLNHRRNRELCAWIVTFGYLFVGLGLVALAELLAYQIPWRPARYSLSEAGAAGTAFFYVTEKWAPAIWLSHPDVPPFGGLLSLLMLASGIVPLVLDYW